MTPASDARAPLAAFSDLARLLELPLLEPQLNDSDIAAGCELARTLGLAAVCVRPSDADAAVRWLEGSGVAVASVCGYPYGASSTAVKQYEVRDLLRRGVREIRTIFNSGKMQSRQFPYMEMEVAQLAAACRENNATLLASFESQWLADDMVAIACRIAKRAEVHCVAPSLSAHALDALTPLIRLCGGRIALAASGAASLEEAKAQYAAGCGRIITSAARRILDEWRQELAAAASAQTAPAPAV